MGEPVVVEPHPRVFVVLQELGQRRHFLKNLASFIEFVIRDQT